MALTKFSGFSALPTLITLTGENSPQYQGRGFWKKVKKIGKKAFKIYTAPARFIVKKVAKPLIKYSPAGLIALTAAKHAKKMLQKKRRPTAAPAASLIEQITARREAAAAPQPAPEAPEQEQEQEETPQEQPAPQQPEQEETPQEQPAAEAEQEQESEAETEEADETSGNDDIFSAGIDGEE